MVIGENVGVLGGVVGVGGVELLGVVDVAVVVVVEEKIGESVVVGERIGEKVVSLKGVGAGVAHLSAGAVIGEGGGGVVLLLEMVGEVVKSIVGLEVVVDEGVETESGMNAAVAHRDVVDVGVAGVEDEVFGAGIIVLWLVGTKSAWMLWLGLWLKL